MADAIRVPEPLSSDTDDVTDALDVAQSLWENGKKVDAIHWVKRAAESARSGDPARMASLVRAAEDLERASAPRAATPPPVPTPKAAPPPLPGVSRPPPPPVPKVSKPPPMPTAQVPTVPPPPAMQSVAATAIASVPPPAPTPRPIPSVRPAPSPAAPPVQTAPSAQIQASPSAPVRTSPSTQSKISVPSVPPGPAPAPMIARPSKVPPQLLQQPASEDRVRLAPSPSDKTLRVRATMRVSVKTSVRDGTLFVVRPLADGAAVPTGTREALLTFVHDEADDMGAPT